MEILHVQRCGNELRNLTTQSYPDNSWMVDVMRRKNEVKMGMLYSYERMRDEYGGIGR
jgi:hypothetical protein